MLVSCLANPVTDTRAARSILDFETPDDLRVALQHAILEEKLCVNPSPSTPNRKSHLNQKKQKRADAVSVTTETSYSSTSSTTATLDASEDWVLKGYNPASTQEQTLEQEFQRLLTLKSYDLLDITSDPTLERITAMTGRMLSCPIAYIGTMDLGRYNILAGKGLGTLKNVHRKGTFCEHVIQSNRDVVVIEDASQDTYLRENWFVHNGPKTRFYAAAKLVAPEGYTLGTLCVIDPMPRPDGLSLSDKQNLMDMADMAVEYMVQRKEKLNLKDPAQQAASAAHDLITPLTGIDLTLSSLKEDANLTEAQREQLRNANRCVSVVKGICRDLLHTASNVRKNQQDIPCQNHHDAPDDPSSGVVNIDKLMERISTVMEHHPREVPLLFSIDPQVPREIVSHDLMIFRSALNYITRACRTTPQGSVRFRVSKDTSEEGPAMIRFTCQDTGPSVPLEEYPRLFEKPSQWSDLTTMTTAAGLCSVAQHMIHLGGKYGYQPPATGERMGATFWFAVPLFLPEVAVMTAPAKALQGSSSQDNEHTPHFPMMVSQMRRKVLHTTSSNDVEDVAGSVDTRKRTKTALVIEDTLVIRKALSRCLSKLGFDVVQAENGFVGLQKLKEARYDLVLCDFLMPVLDGVDCVEQFRAWEAKHRPDSFQQYIVGISAHCQENDIQLGIRAGMNDFRPKPLTMKDLKALQESDAIQERGRQLDRIVAAEAGGDCTGNEDGANDFSNHDEDNEVSIPVFNCLIGAESNSNYSQLVKAMCPSKWKVVTVHDGSDALELLKIQNWDLVILDDDLPRLSGSRCALRFREWEKCHRINRQRNMVLASAYLNASSMDATKVLMPYGFEYMLEKPYEVDVCQKFIQQVQERHTTNLTGMHIIAH